MSVAPTPFRWSVREDGNTVIVEFFCRDNYEAIELAEVIAEGMRTGSLEFEFDEDGSSTSDPPPPSSPASPSAGYPPSGRGPDS